MKIINSNFLPRQKSTNWSALAYFNLYRILLSGLFVVLIHISQIPEPLGSLNKDLFISISHSYLFISICFSFFILNQFPRFNLQIAFHVLVDIIMLSLLMYSSNGLSSGFGMLIVIAVAGGSILRAGRIAILFAAIATLAVLGHEIYLQFFKFYSHVNYIHAGILGATFFFTAVIGNLLAARVKETEAIAEQQAIEINELAKLNEHIVQRLQSGIIVLDSNDNILLMNESAKYLLKRPDEDSGNVHEYVKYLIKEHLERWLLDDSQQNIIVSQKEKDIELQISFIKLEQGLDYKILVFMEDISVLRQRVQHLKLASLGRLTASIAHEVRNPLGAINHAGQLLRESNSLTVEDERLTQIIYEHSIRINNIIENVLSVSRREQSIPEEIDLSIWLKSFKDELLMRYELSQDSIEIRGSKNKNVVKIDPSQLRQVIWNLSENALRYSKQFPYLTFSSGIDDETDRTFIDIIDYGSGISEEIKEHLFEPFFTTEAKGSGLGLYLARELCEANQANLSLHSSSDSGTIFRIIFMHKNKKMS